VVFQNRSFSAIHAARRVSKAIHLRISHRLERVFTLANLNFELRLGAIRCYRVIHCVAAKLDFWPGRNVAQLLGRQRFAASFAVPNWVTCFCSQGILWIVEPGKEAIPTDYP
jgi:hypothetical protein